MPAGWEIGDQVLPSNLEEKRAFLGLDNQKMEEKKGGIMSEPKVK